MPKARSFVGLPGAQRPVRVEKAAINEVESQRRGPILKAPNGAPLIQGTPLLAGPVVDAGNFLDVYAGFGGNETSLPPRLTAVLRLARLQDKTIDVAVTYRPVVTGSDQQVTYEYIAFIVKGLDEPNFKYYVLMNLTYTSGEDPQFVQGYFCARIL